MNHLRRRVALGIAVCALLAASVTQVVAFAPANTHFERTWARTDKPVADGLASRTWMWGTEAFTNAMQERYIESPGDTRTVQYFDKTRMEITQPGGNQNDIWFVTNGLLVMEMVTGRMQIGDDTFQQYFTARENVAGDEDDNAGPTYTTFGKLMSKAPLADGALITQRINRAAEITSDAGLAVHNVTAAQRLTVPGIDHQVASPFWTFMNSNGSIYENGVYTTGTLFPNPYYATGLPITEAYWAEVKVGGQQKDVLIQCFERRCLTFTPGNPDGWKVEAGNVGQHYYRWRYEDIPASDGNPCPDIVHEERMYVVEANNHRVQVLDMHGGFICEWGGGPQPGGLFSPRAIQLDEYGNVIVLSHGWIQKFNPRGGYEDAFPVSIFTQDFAIGPNGYFYTTGQSLASIVVYDPDGTYVTEFDGGADKLISPIGIAVDDAGDIYVVDRGTRYATKYAPDFTFLTMFGGPGDPEDGDEFDVSTDITVDRFGRVYVTDSGYVKTFTYQGASYKADGHWGGVEQDTIAGDARIFVITGVDPSEPVTVFVGDTWNDILQVWNFDNGVAVRTDSIGSPGAGPGQFNSPYGAVVAVN